MTIGAKNSTQTFFFSNFSGAPGISRQNPGISRPKSLISQVSRDASNFLAPTRSRGRPPPHRKISGPKSLGLGSFFVPETKARLLKHDFPVHGKREALLNLAYEFHHKALTFLVTRQKFKRCFRGSLHRGASFKVEKAPFAARKKHQENRKNEVKLPPPSVLPPEALYEKYPPSITRHLSHDPSRTVFPVVLQPIAATTPLLPAKKLPIAIQRQAQQGGGITEKTFL